MIYQIEFHHRADKDMENLPRDIKQRIIRKLVALSNNLTGDVKKLTNIEPQYRLRVGDYRVLFEIEGARIVIHKIRHRREAYDR